MAAVPATPDAAAATAPPIRAADHFPRVLKPCKAAAEPFFKCFSAATLDPNADVRLAGAAGHARSARQGSTRWQRASQLTQHSVWRRSLLAGSRGAPVLR